MVGSCRWALIVAAGALSAGCSGDGRDADEAGDTGSGVATDTGIGSSSDTSTSGGADESGEVDEGGADEGAKLDVLGESTGGTAETGEICEQDVDIVFVMDVSTTMGPFLNTLAGEIAVVDAALQQLDTPSEPHYGLAVFVDDAQLINAGVPYTDVTQLQADFESWAAFTSGNQQTSGSGSNTDWPENSLDALWLAANVFQWRPSDSTLRIIIHTTDDTFWDGPTTVGLGGITVDHGYAETVDALQAQQVRVFSFADLIGGSCECEDVSMGWSTPYMGMDPIPEATGGGWWNINDVLASTISLSASIDQAVDETICVPYPPTD